MDAGAGFVSYVWSDNSLNQQLEVNTGGPYTVTVTNTAGCTNSAQITVIENANPTPSILGPADFCAGTTVALDAGANFVDYLWSDGTATQTLEVTAGGTYLVTVTDNNGCQGVDQWNINENVATPPVIDGTLSFCEGDNTLLEAMGDYVDYTWSGGSNNASIVVDVPGTYTVTVTDANTCTSTASVEVVINPNPDPVIAGSATFCIGSTTILDAGSSYASYLWSDGSVSSTLEIAEAGTYAVTVSNQNGCTGIADFMVEQSAALSPIISGNPDFCIGENTVLDAGSGFTTYLWSTGSEQQSIDVAMPGVYGITVSDASGCSGTAELLVNQLDLPSVSILGNAPICSGSTLTLDAGAGLTSYLWSEGSMTQTLEVSEAGIYEVTINDANGCSNIAQTEVIVYPNPEPIIEGVNSFCTGNSTTLSGGTFAAYTWSTGAMEADITIDQGGIYGLTVTDENACTGTTSIEVSENESLTPVIVGDLAVCDGESSLLDAGGGFATYLWSDGSVEQTLMVNSTGTYQVTVSDANGCTGETATAFNVNALPEPSIAGSATFCIGTSTVLDAGNDFVAYQWSNGVQSATNEITIAGTYELTVTDENGCTGTTAFTVTESESLQPVISGALNYCTGTTTVLDVGSGFDSYTWSNGMMNSSITVNAPGTYAVTVSDASGCSGTAVVEVVEDALPPVTILGNAAICEGETVDLDAGAGFSAYTWSDGSLNQQLSVNVSGSYGVTVVDANGCSNTDEVEVIVHPNPLPTIAGLTTFCNGTSTNLDAGAGYVSYNWSDGQSGQNITVNTPGTIAVTVSDVNGCVGVASVLLEEQENLNPLITGTTLICEGEQTQLEVDAGFATYLWSNGTATSSITIDLPGDYTVTVSDASGCTGEAQINVAQNSPPFADVLPSVNTCNTNAGGADLDLDDLIIDGEQNGIWVDIDGSGAIGTPPLLNFAGVLPGTYTFSYTTTTAVAPCVDPTYFTTVVVADCACPSVIFNTPDPLCNSNGVLDLNSQILSGSSGIWEILSAPVGSNPAILSGSFLDATNADAGNYLLAYTLDDSPPPGCDPSFLLEVLVDPTVSAGTANPPLAFCQTELTLVNLATELTGADGGGIWTETSNLPSVAGAFDPLTGTFNTADQLPGIYTFQYEVLSTGVCPADAETVSITIHEQPIAEAGIGQELTCENNELLLDATGSSVGQDFAVLWEGPGVIVNGNTLNPTINAPGIFTVTIVNLLTGCESMDQVEVTQNAAVPFVEIVPANDLTCDSSSVVLLGINTNGIDNLTWQWTGPGIDASNANVQYPSVSAPGTYTLVITDLDNDCASSPALVEVLDNSTPPEVIVELPLAQLDCNNSEVALNASNSSGTVALEYQWLDADGNILGTQAILNTTTAGTYSLLVSDVQNGCTATELITVTEDVEFPLADAGNPQLLNCALTTAQLDGSGSSSGTEMVYTWLSATGAILQGPDNNPFLAVDAPGNYTLLVGNTSNGCVSPATVEVTQDIELPNVDIANPDQLDCTVNEVLLNGTNSSTGPQYLYQWLDANDAPLSDALTLMVSDAGLYQLRITDTNNQCVALETVSVTANTDVPSAALIDVGTPSCFGERDGSIQVSEVFGGTAPYVYGIDGSPFASFEQFDNLPDGDYTISLQDAAGCTWDTVVTVTQPVELSLELLAVDLQIQLGDSTQLQANPNIPTSRIDTLIWTPAEALRCTDLICLNPFTNIVDATTFAATLIDVDGCSASASLRLEVAKDRLIYIPSAFSPNDDQNNDLFMIHGGVGVRQVNMFRIFNRWGELIFEGTDFQPDDPDFGWDGTFRGELMNPAVFVYFAEVAFEDGRTELYKGDVTLMR
ncbi:MAG: gliding motility-associated C-terminal domain-containing protein [Bacteroidota bacterium]